MRNTAAIGRRWRRPPILIASLCLLALLALFPAIPGVSGGAAAASRQDARLPALNVLLMGVDARAGEAIDIGVRPDVLAVLHLDPAAGGCRILSIPRDSRVNLPGYGMSKINHALAVGGITFQRTVVEEFLGIALDRHALIDFSGVESMVDAIEGVAVDVTEGFTLGDVTLEPGEQTLDGPEALAYVRYRGGPDGDFGRIRRQQEVARAILSRAAALGPLELINELLPLLQDHVRTDISPAEILVLAGRFRTTCTEETIETFSLDGTIATFDDPIYAVPLSYVVVDEAEVRRKVAELTASP